MIRTARRLAFVVAAALAAPPLAAQQPAASRGDLVLLNANLFDPATNTATRGATVVIEKGRIARIARGPIATDSLPSLDLTGRWVVPGLIDAHAHIASTAALRRALESGVTTARSASTAGYQDVGLRELVRQGTRAGPEILAAGLYVTPDLGDNVLADPRLAALAGGVRTLDELRLLVRINLDHGVDVIKTRGTERAGVPTTDPRQQVYTATQLRAVVEAAATRNVPVLAHAHGDEGAYAAVVAGVRSIEHGTYLADSTLRRMKQQGTWLVPTISTMEDLNTESDPGLRLRGPHMVPRLLRTVREAYRLGIPMATGSDADYEAASTERIAEEIGRLAAAGLSPLDALRAGTSGAAELLRVGDRTGRLREGYEADLLIVEEHPLDNLLTLRDPLVVVSNGVIGFSRWPFTCKGPTLCHQP